MRELDHKIDQHMEMASRRLEILKTSVDLADHVRIIMGYDDELALLSPSDPESAKRIAEIEASVEEHVKRIKDLPVVTSLLGNIARLREEVSLRGGLKKEMDDVRALPEKIRAIIKSRGFRTGKEHYVQTLAQNLALFAMAFYGKTIVYRTTDFKSNEYRNLLGGNLFEHHEDNPIAGLPRCVPQYPRLGNRSLQAGPRRVRRFQPADDAALRAYPGRSPLHADLPEPGAKLTSGPGRPAHHPDVGNPPTPSWPSSSSRSSTDSPSVPTT